VEGGIWPIQKFWRGAPSIVVASARQTVCLSAAAWQAHVKDVCVKIHIGGTSYGLQRVYGGRLRPTGGAGALRALSSLIFRFFSAKSHAYTPLHSTMSEIVINRCTVK